MKKFLFYTLVVYVAYSQYLIYGYEAMNDRLQAANMMLLHSCTTGQMGASEKAPYKK